MFNYLVLNLNRPSPRYYQYIFPSLSIYYKKSLYSQNYHSVEDQTQTLNDLRGDLAVLKRLKYMYLTAGTSSISHSTEV